VKTRADVLKHLEAIESGRPTHTEGDGIPITQEAQEILEPYYAALMDHTEPFINGIQTLTAESVWYKCVGDQYVLTTYEGFCGAYEGVIGIEVAKRVIEQLKSVYSITV
jgi:hypothetical protein